MTKLRNRTQKFWNAHFECELEGDQDLIKKVVETYEIGEIIENHTPENISKTISNAFIKLDPNNAYGHILLSDYYLVKSDFEMAIKETLFAEKLDPLNPMIGTILGLKYGMANNYEKANTQFNKVLECFPNYPAVWSELGFIQFINGQKTAAQNSWKRFQEIQGNEVMVKLYMEQPLEDGLKYWLAEVKKKSPKYCSYPTLIAQVYMLLLQGYYLL